MDEENQAEDWTRTARVISLIDRLGFAVRFCRRLGRKGRVATSVHEGNCKGWKKKLGGLEAPDSD